MQSQPVQSINKEDIPVIDISSLFEKVPDYDGVGKALREAAEGTGFFYVKNHIIDATLMQKVRALSQQFFACEEADKQSVLAKDTHRGLLAIGGAKMESQANVDLKESFIWGADLPTDNPRFIAGNKMFAPNRWPSFLPEIQQALNQYMQAANDCGQQLLKAFAASLGIEHDYFAKQFDQPISRGTLIHYPPQAPTASDDQFGVSPHTDFGTLTLLAQDNTGGLRVKSRSGQWVTAHPIEDTLVVNVGDLLARWTNDRFQSTEHAVVNNSGKERYSIVVAVDPNWDAVISPVTLENETPHYDPVLCGEYIQGRFDRSFNYHKQT